MIQKNWFQEKWWNKTMIPTSISHRYILKWEECLIQYWRCNLDPREVFLHKKLVCECGKRDFDSYYVISETGHSDTYVFYSTCKKCGTHWSFTCAVPRLERSYKNPRCSDQKKIENKKWKLLDVERKIPLVWWDFHSNYYLSFIRTATPKLLSVYKQVIFFRKISIT